MNRYPLSIKKSQKGAVLLEALIAVVLFSFGILALTGLQAAMIKNTDDAKYRAEASFIAQQKISEIWINGNNTNLASYTLTDSPVPQLPNGKTSVAVSANRELTVTVNWTMPGGTEHTYLANARVEGVE
ncbi:MAG: type IV pilus modification PilV family protein [Methylotenera sp.]